MSDLSQTVKALSALAQETRLSIFRTLMAAGCDGISAGALAQTLGVAPNNLSAHLNILYNADLIAVERKGRFKFYSARIETINAMLGALVETCCHGHPEVCGMLASLDDVQCQ